MACVSSSTQTHPTISKTSSVEFRQARTHACTECFTTLALRTPDLCPKSFKRLASFTQAPASSTSKEFSQPSDECSMKLRWVVRQKARSVESNFPFSSIAVNSAKTKPTSLPLIDPCPHLSSLPATSIGTTTCSMAMKTFGATSDLWSVAIKAISLRRYFEQQNVLTAVTGASFTTLSSITSTHDRQEHCTDRSRHPCETTARATPRSLYFSLRYNLWLLPG